MAMLKCKMCGGNLELIPGENICECENCGSRQTVPDIDDERKAKLYERANKLRFNCDFDKAATVYENIVNDFPDDAESYWGLILCKYGIEYVDDPATGKKVPTCHRSSFDSLMDDPDFDMVMENSEDDARALYRQEAKQIEEIRKGIVEISGKEPPYDIFICYKETDKNGERTLDSVLAQDIYDDLTSKGYRIFFARISLEDKLGTEYEPYIFAALNSAKVMLAIGTSYDNYNAVWVKNEWGRFLKLMARDKEKYLIPCFKDIDAYDIPKEFAKFQAQDLGKVGATQDLVRGIDKIFGRNKETTEVKQSSKMSGDSSFSVYEAQTQSLFKRGKIALEDGDFEQADRFFEQVLNNDAEFGLAYLGKALAQERVSDKESLANKVFLQIKSREQSKKIEPGKIIIDIARDFDKDFGILNGFTDEEINEVFEDLYPTFSLNVSEEYYSRVYSTINDNYIMGDNKNYHRALLYSNTEVKKYLNETIDIVKQLLDEQINKTERIKIADLEQKIEAWKEDISKVITEKIMMCQKINDDRENKLKLYEKEVAERKKNIQNQIYTLKTNMANLKGVFAKNEKERMRSEIIDLEIQLQSETVPKKVHKLRKDEIYTILSAKTIIV